ncbi:thioesterase family protein [Hymenobacter koreensis]|uniref:Thioesterase family protein n=1 Tax=Hymenobacter koreensis TaxID=1084523 RepID=A0ABP8IVG1_9BACT
MTNPFRPGDQQTHRYTVVPADFAAFEAGGGLVHPVLSTFALAREMEWAGRLFVLQMREAGEEGIGTMLQVQHHAPAFAGETVLLTATFASLAGRELTCIVEARVGERLVATGRTGQRIVNKQKLEARFAELRTVTPRLN